MVIAFNIETEVLRSRVLILKIGLIDAKCKGWLISNKLTRSSFSKTVHKKLTQEFASYLHRVPY